MLSNLVINWITIPHQTPKMYTILYLTHLTYLTNGLARKGNAHCI